jgi:hypothetical protein
MAWHVDNFGWHVCEPCDRDFNNYSALMQHLNNSSHHNYCDECDRDFSTNWALIQHYVQSRHHAYCQSCDEHFDDCDDLDDHMDKCHSWCRSCNKTFPNDRGLQEHWRQSHADRYCKICERLFNNASNLRSVCVTTNPLRLKPTDISLRVLGISLQSSHLSTVIIPDAPH